MTQECPRLSFSLFPFVFPFFVVASRRRNIFPLRSPSAFDYVFPSLRRSSSLVIVILFFLLVDFSTAETLRIPSASNVTPKRRKGRENEKKISWEEKTATPFLARLPASSSVNRASVGYLLSISFVLFSVLFAGQHSRMLIRTSDNSNRVPSDSCADGNRQKRNPETWESSVPPPLLSFEPTYTHSRSRGSRSSFLSFFFPLIARVAFRYSPFPGPIAP